MSPPSPSLPTEPALAAALEAFLRTRFQVADDDAGFTRQTDLWNDGYVDSAGVVEVLAFLEAQVGARLPEDLLFEPEFTTIDGMAKHSLAAAQAAA